MSWGSPSPWGCAARPVGKQQWERNVWVRNGDALGGGRTRTGVALPWEGEKDLLGLDGVWGQSFLFFLNFFLIAIFSQCAGHEALGDLHWAPSADGTSRARRGTAGKGNEPSPTLWLHLGVDTNRTGSDAFLGCFGLWGFFLLIIFFLFG